MYLEPPDPDLLMATMPRVGDIIYRQADNVRGLVSAVWSPDDDEVPEWADEDTGIDVLVRFRDADASEAVPVDTLNPYEGDETLSWTGVDYADYIGTELDGYYISAACYGGQWYVSTLFDFDSIGHCELITSDDGPFDSEIDALRTAGEAAADLFNDGTNDIPAEESDAFEASYSSWRARNFVDRAEPVQTDPVRVIIDLMPSLKSGQLEEVADAIVAAHAALKL